MMMRCSLSLFGIAIGAIAFSPCVAAAEVQVPSKPVHQQAKVLSTQPITINTVPTQAFYSADKLNQIANSISAASLQASKPIDLFDLLKAPDATLQRLSEGNQYQSPHVVEPSVFFKIPSLDSGLSVTVNNF